MNLKKNTIVNINNWLHEQKYHCVLKNHTKKVFKFYFATHTTFLILIIQNIFSNCTFCLFYKKHTKFHKLIKIL